MDAITIYSIPWCSDCRRTKVFLKEHGVEFREVNIEEDASAEALVLKVNNGKRKVPTLEVGGRYFVCSPFDPYQLSSALGIPLNM